MSIDHEWEEVKMKCKLGKNPTILCQLASENGGQSAVVRMKNVDSDGSKFKVRLQEEEANDGTHVAEDVHFIAIENGNGGSEHYYARDGDEYFRNSLTFHAGTNQNITEADTKIDLDFTFFNNDDMDSVSFFSQIRTFDGDNACGIRLKNLDLEYSEATIFIEEEQSKDDEIDHAKEKVCWLILQSFEL